MPRHRPQRPVLPLHNPPPYQFRSPTNSAGAIVRRFGGIKNAVRFGHAAVSGAATAATYAGKNLISRYYPTRSGKRKESEDNRESGFRGPSKQSKASSSSTPSGESSKMPRTARAGRRLFRRGTKYRKSRTGKKKRNYRKPGKRRTKKPFSTKGFRLIDRQYYSIDFITPAGTSASGLANATQFSTNFFKQHLNTTSNTAGPYPITDGGTTSSLGYARLICNVGAFATTSGIMEHFNQYKVNWIKHTFLFPDQEADTTNDKYPLRVGVNYGDTYRISWHAKSNIGNTEAETNSRNFIERPGWKWFQVKRMNKLVIKYRPNQIVIKEQKVGGVENDANMSKKHSWCNCTQTGLLQDLIGPTIGFQFGAVASNGAGTPSSAQIATWNVTQFTATKFLAYTKVKTEASVSFRDPNCEAND